MVSYDYGQLPQQNLAYQQQQLYSTLPPQQQSIDPNNPYSVASPYSTQPSLPPSHYGSMMMYPPKPETNLPSHALPPYSMQPVTYPMGASGGIFDIFSVPS
jgi:hypothetical protein